MITEKQNNDRAIRGIKMLDMSASFWGPVMLTFVVAMNVLFIINLAH